MAGIDVLCARSKINLFQLFRQWIGHFIKVDGMHCILISKHIMREREREKNESLGIDLLRCLTLFPNFPKKDKLWQETLQQGWEKLQVSLLSLSCFALSLYLSFVSTRFPLLSLSPGIRIECVIGCINNSVHKCRHTYQYGHVVHVGNVHR